MSTRFNILSNYKNCTAFTLAEVLITLGIIGVVAAMTMPAVIKNYKKHVTETKLKSAYSQISQLLEKVNYENDMMFAPAELSEYAGYNYNLSDAVFKKYFAPYIKIVKELNKNDRFNICNYQGEGCYKNTSYKCVITSNNIGLCFVIEPTSGRLSIQIITEPSKDVVYAGKDAFAFTVPRDIRENNYNLNLSHLLSTLELSDETVKTYCTSVNAFPNGKQDREFFCTVLIYKNGWKIPKDYPVRF